MFETDTHIYFWGSWLGNFHPCKFETKGMSFNSSEQLFMYMKALVFKDKEIAEKILQSSTPKEAKKLGRKVRGFDEAEWNKIRDDIMVYALRCKFKVPELRRLLLNTGEKILVEGSPFDRVWGVGIRYDDKSILDDRNWQGMNLLGTCLMDVRNEIKLEVIND